MSKLPRDRPAMRDGFCECGCGQTTPRATKTRAGRGYKAGDHHRFVLGHAMRGRRKYTRVPVEERFWRYVAPDGECWVWTGVKNSRGYGHISLPDGTRMYAHRFSWEQANGAPVPPGIFVLHRCDNPPCVRPEHLFLGTRQDNFNDSAAKGRHYHGERHALAKLTDGQVAAIRKHFRPGCRLTRAQLAEMLGVSTATLRDALSGRTWRHVPDGREPA